VPANVLKDLPSSLSLDYSRVSGANCKLVVGCIPLLVGMVGPLTLNDESIYIPMATIEGCHLAFVMGRVSLAVNRTTPLKTTYSGLFCDKQKNLIG